MTVTLDLLTIVGIAALASAIGSIGTLCFCLWCWKDAICKVVRAEHREIEGCRAIKEKH